MYNTVENVDCLFGFRKRLPWDLMLMYAAVRVSLNNLLSSEICDCDCAVHLLLNMSCDGSRTETFICDFLH